MYKLILSGFSVEDDKTFYSEIEYDNENELKADFSIWFNKLLFDSFLNLPEGLGINDDIDYKKAYVWTGKDLTVVLRTSSD